MNDTIARSETMFRLMMEAAPYGTLLVDQAGSIIFINPQIEKLFGYRREELLGQPVEILVPERFRSAHRNYQQNFYTEPKVRPMGVGRDLYAVRKDGNEFPAEIGLTVINTGSELLVLSTIVDITERKRGEETLRQSEARLKLAQSTANAGIWDWDMHTGEVSWSDESYTLLGLRPGECEPSATNWRRSVHPDDRDLVQAAVASVMSQRREAIDLEYRIVHPDGSVRWVNDRGQVLYDPSNRAVRMIGIMIDITERKQVEENLARSNAELQEFAYVTSHDLQEPLRAVAGCVEILRRRYQGKIDAGADELITHAVEGATRMRDLINDLLAYSRVGSRGQPFEPTDCTVILKYALANLEIALKESGAVVTCDDLPRVTADPVQLTQLFQNLIGNAIKFRGERTPAIHIQAIQKKGEWVFSVCDNGIGIEAQYFDRIFHIFQRLHARTSYAGTGIGLAICKKIVERHGGRIWVESQPGEGSTFYFTIPIASRA